jgi:hypothetical protein
MNYGDKLVKSYGGTLASGLTAFMIGYWFGFINLDRLIGTPGFADIRVALGARLPTAVLLVVITTGISLVVGVFGAFFGFVAVQGAAASSPSGGAPPFFVGILFMLTGYGVPFAATSLLATVIIGRRLGLDQVANLSERVVRGQFGFPAFVAPVLSGLSIGIVIAWLVYSLTGDTRRNRRWGALESAINNGDWLPSRTFSIQV